MATTTRRFAPSPLPAFLIPTSSDHSPEPSSATDSAPLAAELRNSLSPALRLFFEWYPPGQNQHELCPSAVHASRTKWEAPKHAGVSACYDFTVGNTGTESFTNRCTFQMAI